MLTLVHLNADPGSPTAWNDHALGKKIALYRRARQQAAAWHSRTRQLDALPRLDDRLLADIGLTREEQILTCAKLFRWSP
jgi:uncharacterized protein YjiS (DUF1127 family)